MWRNARQSAQNHSSCFFSQEQTNRCGSNLNYEQRIGERKKNPAAGFLGQHRGAYHRSSAGGGSTGNWARTPGARRRWACSPPHSWTSPGLPRRSRCPAAGHWRGCPGPRSDLTAAAGLLGEKTAQTLNAPSCNQHPLILLQKRGGSSRSEEMLKEHFALWKALDE